MGLLSFDKFESLSKGDGGASGVNGILEEELFKKQSEYMTIFNQQMQDIENNANDVAKAIQAIIFPNGLNVDTKNFLDIFKQLNPVIQQLSIAISGLFAIGILSGLKKLALSFASVFKSVSMIGIGLGVLGGIMLYNFFSDWFKDMDKGAKIFAGAATVIVAAGAIIAATILAIKGLLTWGTAIPIMLATLGAGIAGAMALFDGIKMPTYAQGGYPEKGSMFIAGEAGAEIVANVGGGQSAVANIPQIEEAMYRALKRISSEENQGTEQQNINLQLDINGREFARATYGDYQAESKRRCVR